MVFLLEAFKGKEDMADSVNHLLVVGFYLINIGFILIYLQVGAKPTGVVEGIEYIAPKLGVVLLVLGAMRFPNIFNFDRMREKGRSHEGNVPPILNK